MVRVTRPINRRASACWWCRDRAPFRPGPSKATDIALVCGLDWLRRIERGVGFYITASRALTAEELGRIAKLLHDRMTESVLRGDADAAVLFTEGAPKPLASVPRSLDALTRANVQLGLALSADEIEYCTRASSGSDATPPMSS